MYRFFLVCFINMLPIPFFFFATYIIRTSTCVWVAWACACVLRGHVLGCEHVCTGMCVS